MRIRGGKPVVLRYFFDPSPAGDGELRSLRDAGICILGLPPAEAEREHWQIAMEFLISAAERGGIVMMARIAMSRTMNHGLDGREISPLRSARAMPHGWRATGTPV